MNKETKELETKCIGKKIRKKEIGKIQTKITVGIPLTMSYSSPLKVENRKRE